MHDTGVRGRRRSALLALTLLLLVGVVVATALWARSPGDGAADARRGAAAANDADARARAGVLARASIRRDRFGVPHILADTEEEAAFAHGYVTAEDYGPELARLFLRARGAQASVFGEEFVQEDLRMRTLGIFDVASEGMHELPPFMQAILDGYASGYNAYLAKHRDRFPDWAAPVTGIDILAHARAVLLADFALNLRGWADDAAGQTGASTVWAVGRPLSASGHGLLMANPHLPWAGATLFHEIHISVPGTINVSGGTLIGVPVVLIGFNDTLGWAHTVNRIDSDDLYELTLDQAGTHYAYGRRWLPLPTRTITIEVRKDGGVERREHRIVTSHYGPVRMRHGKAYALKSANLSSVNFLTQWNLMGKAASLREFTDAVKMQQLPMFNLAYADRAGNIWYLFNGRIPLRSPGHDWSGVVPGNSSRMEWFAIRPFGDLPQLLNPKAGYIQNANDAPWFTTLERSIDPSGYAGYVEGEGLGWRSQIGLRILSAERKLTLERLMNHKYNAEVPFAVRVKGELVELIRSRQDETWQRAARIIDAWDGQANPDSRGAVLFVAWWDVYRGLTAGKPFRTPWSQADPIKTPSGLSDRGQAIEAFGRALTGVTQRFGAPDVTWGEAHRLRRGSLDLPLGGLSEGLWNVHYRRAADGALVAVGGDSYVLAVEFAESGPRAFSVVAYGESSNPRSRHFADQASVYAKGGFKPAWFSEQDIAANLSEQYHPNR